MEYFIIILVYLLSVIFNYLHIKIGYSEGGRYENSDPEMIEFWFTFIPVFNTIICVVSWACFYPVKQNRRKFNLIKFFNIKKPI